VTVTTGIVIAATPLKPPEGGKYWAFHLVNDSSERIESVVVEQVDYEWGGVGRVERPETRFGPIEPASSLEIWRDDDSAAELSMSITLRVCGASGERTITAEFPKLYLVRSLSPIPILEADGFVGVVETVGPPRSTKTPK
jgi:hypothetical protein